MAAKRVVGKAKLQIRGGAATPAPPLGPTLSGLGVNIMQFCQSFNAATQDRKGDLVPVIITAYRDASFDFITLEPPVSELLKQAAGVEKGADDPLRRPVGPVSRERVEAIAKRKMEELNTRDLDAAFNVVMGTARSMGIYLEEDAAEVEAAAAAAQAAAEARDARAAAMEAELEAPIEEEEDLEEAAEADGEEAGEEQAEEESE